MVMNSPQESMVNMNEEKEVKEKRDEEASPYWIDDPILKGKDGFLSSKEKKFFETLIKEYLTPFENKYEKRAYLEKQVTDRSIELEFQLIN